MLHGVAETQGNLTIGERIVIDGDAVRSTNGILTAITLSDRILLIVLTSEVILQLVDNLTCLLGQTVESFSSY